MTMIAPAKHNFIMWLGLNEETGSFRDYVDASRAFTRSNVAQVAGHPSKYGGDWEQGTPSKCYIADAAWNTFGNESITMGAWSKPETFLATWDSGSWLYEYTAIMAKAVSLNDAEFFLGFDSAKRPIFNLNNTAAGNLWDTSAVGGASTFVNGDDILLLGGYDADANQAFVKLYDDAGALLASSTTADSLGFGGSGQSVPFWIGGQQETAAAGDGTHYWDGPIDEAFIYKGIFSADELAWIVNGGDGREWSDLLTKGMPLMF